MGFLKAITLTLCIAATQSYAYQSGDSNSGTPQSKTVVPGKEYDAGWLHRMLYGANWRDLWTTPIQVEVLDLTKYGGGLTPKKAGGGKQTASLRLKGADGKEYKFRSINKDARKSLPEDLQQSIAGDFLQDQISSQNPMAALVVSPMLNAVGVLNAEPVAYVMPDDERLGEFRAEFGGMLGTIEENPKESDDGESFAGADKFVSTFELFHRMEEDHNQQVDTREFLKARLMDIFLGDWDRHADQWRWAGYKHSHGRSWKPIPRDRDWAFTKFQGVIPSLIEESVPELKGFGESYPDIEGLTWKGRHLDHRLLVYISKPVWDSVTSTVVDRLTDPVIENAVHRLPPEMYAKRGSYLEHILKTRRSWLTKASNELYELCTAFPDIHGSDKDEVAQVDFQDDYSVKLGLYDRNSSTGEKIEPPYFERVFSEKETRDLRVYLLGGNDRAIVSGKNRSAITVRVIGGDGNDELIDHSTNGVKFYDSDEGTAMTDAKRSSTDRSIEEEPQTDSARYESHFRDYGHRWMPMAWFSITPDYGLFVGGGTNLTDYGFRAHPEVYYMEFRAGMATTALRFRFDYRGDFYSILKGTVVSLHARASQLEASNFFGFGNESSYNSDSLTNGYYRVHQQFFIVEPSLRFPVDEQIQFSVGGTFKNLKSDLATSTFLNQVLPYGSEESFKIASLNLGFKVDTRDAGTASTRGILLDLRGSFFPTMLDNDLRFEKFQGDFRTYLSTSVITDATLALQVAGEKIWGDRVPFFEAAYLGGLPTVRGFEAERFAGDASVYGNAELRMHVGKFSLFMPVTYGLAFFGGAGQVSLAGQSSALWHTAIGGGLWFSVYRPNLALSIAAAKSHEKLALYVTGGFAF